MLSDRTRADSFSEFVESMETRLRQTLTASFGVEIGREAAADALAYTWENWPRIQDMENPVGYIYTVGKDRARRMRRRRPVVIPQPPTERTPWVEPGLTRALTGLPERQRVVVLLLHGYDWTLSEVAENLGVAKTTVQEHEERGMAKLRRKLGVDQ